MHWRILEAEVTLKTESRHRATSEVWGLTGDIRGEDCTRNIRNGNIQTVTMNRDMFSEPGIALFYVPTPY